MTLKSVALLSFMLELLFKNKTVPLLWVNVPVPVKSTGPDMVRVPGVDLNAPADMVRPLVPMVIPVARVPSRVPVEILTPPKLNATAPDV